MENEYALAPIAFVVVALLVGAALKFALRGSKFPYTVGLLGVVSRLCLASDGILPEKDASLLEKDLDKRAGRL